MTATMRSIGGWVLAVLMPVAAPAATAASDPFLGTWALDKAKSTIAHDPGVKSKEIVFAPTADGGMITETLEMIAGNGGKQVSHIPYAYGKFTPQTGAAYDAFLVTRTGHRMFWTARREGRTVARLQVDLSRDDRQLTFRYLSSAADPTGAVTKDRYVYDRR